jgi:hypothetical protein
MIYFCVFLILILLITIAGIVVQLFNLKQLNKITIQNLENAQSTLNQQQKLLSINIKIAAEFDIEYQKNIILLKTEIIETQKLFFKVISERKNQ